MQGTLPLSMITHMPRPKTHQCEKLSLSWIILTGLILSALPLSAIAAQSTRIATGRILTLPFTLDRMQPDPLMPIMDIGVYINRLNLDRLAGDNKFQIGQTAFVFLKQNGSEAYPYAILHNVNGQNGGVEDDSHMLRARVTEQDGPELTLEYGFERIAPPQRFIQDISKNMDQTLSVSLALSTDGRSSVAALYNGRKVYHQRVILKSVLLGRSSKSDKIAPPT